MYKCKYFNQEQETCVNADCPYRADFCPVSEFQNVCRYARVDRPAPNLEGKCGSCKFATPTARKTSIACQRAKGYNLYKPSYQKGCKKYEKREG